MKAVLLSIRPEWAKKILDGLKTIEVRKTRPKIETPFKCYIYCTKGDEVLPTNDYCGFDMEDFSGDFVANMKVVAEFTCDRIDPIRVFNNGTIQNWECYGLEKSCIPYDDIVRYIGNNRSGYGWHISDLKVYDKPEELGDFTPYCKFMTGDMLSCKSVVTCLYQHRDYNPDGSLFAVTCKSRVGRPPQSWCYVEEVSDA